MARLIVLQGADQGRQFELGAEVVTIGRHSANPIHLHDTQVSRKHLEIQPFSQGFRVVDLGSGNGTRLNGKPVGTAELRTGDRISVGETVLLYSAELSAKPPEIDSQIVQLFATPDPMFRSGILRTISADTATKIFDAPGEGETEWMRSRLANLGVLYEAATAVSHILDVEELLGKIMELVLKAAGADQGCFMLADPETGDLTPHGVRASRGVPKPFAVSRTVIDYVMHEGRAVLVADAATDDRFRGGESIVAHNIREVICAPMRGRHETVGALFLDTHTKPGGRSVFTDDHLRLAVAVAHQAALAVEETRYYQALVNAERLAAVGQTIAGMSHHIKNIMQGVRFGGDLVRLGFESDDREILHKGWKMVERNQARIDELILDMLNYSKEREPILEPTDLARVVRDVLEVVQGRALERQVTVRFTSPSENAPTIECDPEAIHRALLNLVSNALDALIGHDAPQLDVDYTISADGVWAEVRVRDNGPGVPLEKADEIFKPFVSTKGARGTGLGLPVSRKVLREHGGDLFVEPGAGGRFVVRLPVNRDAKSATGEPA